MLHDTGELHKKNHRILLYQVGVSYIELCIGLVVSVGVLMIGMQAYLTLKKQTVKQEEVYQELSISRTVAQHLGQDVRFSGYVGPRTLDVSYPVRNTLYKAIMPYSIFSPEKVIFGFRADLNTCLRYLPSSACKRMKVGSDVVLLHNIPKHCVKVAESTQKYSHSLQTHNPTSIQEGSVCLVANAYGADVFVATLVDKDRIVHDKQVRRNHSGDLSQRYGQEALVCELQTVAYYLGVPDRFDGQYALYRDHVFQEAQELAEGLHSFNAQYGVFVKSNRIEFREASRMTEQDWPWVQTVRIEFKTQRGETYQYEFSIRNRNRLGVRDSVVDGDINANRTSSQTNTIRNSLY